MDELEKYSKIYNEEYFDKDVPAVDWVNWIRTQSTYDDTISGEKLNIESTHYGVVSFRDKNNNYHRVDGPAHITLDYANERVIEVKWMHRNKLHRINGPSVLGNKYGSKLLFSWNKNGLIHNPDGPASLVTVYGIVTEMIWALNGKYHRPAGMPAVVRTELTTDKDGGYSGYKVIEEKWWFQGFNKNPNGPSRIDYRTNEKFWYNPDGVMDREDGPAYIKEGYVEKWYKDGLLHRIGGPAVTSAKGGLIWYKNNMRHRDDGPALIRLEDPSKAQYYIDGKNITKQVKAWMNNKKWTDLEEPSRQLLFKLTWAGKNGN